MTVEFQIPSPLVPTRENYIVSYCKQHDNGTCAVVDVSLDSLRPASKSQSRRRPSGCLIEEWPNGYSKVQLSLLVAFLYHDAHNVLSSLFFLLINTFPSYMG